MRLRRRTPLGVGLALPLLALASMLVGAGQVELRDGLAFLWGDGAARGDERLQTVMWSLRLPRLMAAVLVGGALGAAGVLMQAVTRNPLAEPGLLGVNAGAALGVVVGIAWMGAETGLGYLAWAAAGAALGNVGVLLAARATRGADGPLRLVLAGAALGASFHGVTSAILLAQQSGFDQYRFWEQGSLAGVTLEMVAWVAPAIALGWLAAAWCARPLAALQLGDDVASGLGHRPGRLRLAVACTTTLLTAGAVALAGPVAFLGLLAPFLARAAVGAGLPVQLAMATALGAALMLVADLGARTVALPFETPVSVLTAFVGAPLLVWMARRAGRGAS